MTIGGAALLATLATGLFAGGALYITMVEHPARLESETATAVAQWRPSYRRATVLQASLAVFGAAAAIFCWQGGGGSGWLLAGVTLAAIVAFTLLVVFPTNRRLQDESLDEDSIEALALLEQWGRLHAVRTIASLVAFAIELVSLAGG